MRTRVRFAPSPTGTLTVGNALGAVANRGFGDWMLLRIDDTDPARNVPGGEEAIVARPRVARRRVGRGPVRAERARRAPPRGRGGARPQLFDGVTLCARTARRPTTSRASSTTSTSGSRTSSAATTTGRTSRCTGALHEALGTRAAGVRPPWTDARRGREEALEARRGRDGRRRCARPGIPAEAVRALPRRARASRGTMSTRPARIRRLVGRGDRGASGRGARGPGRRSGRRRPGAPRRARPRARRGRSPRRSSSRRRVRSARTRGRRSSGSASCASARTAASTRRGEGAAP